MIPSTPMGEPRSSLRKYHRKTDDNLMETKYGEQIDVGLKHLPTKFDLYQATMVVVLTVLFGFLPSIFSQVTCNFPTGGVMVDGKGMKFDLHYGLWK